MLYRYVVGTESQEKCSPGEDGMKRGAAATRRTDLQSKLPARLPTWNMPVSRAGGLSLHVLRATYQRQYCLVLARSVQPMLRSPPSDGSALQRSPPRSQRWLSGSHLELLELLGESCIHALSGPANCKASGAGTCTGFLHPSSDRH